jgi:hypothetical protein
MQIEIRLIENRLQLTKFQYFQRALLEFNGTVMTENIKQNMRLNFSQLEC